LSRNIQIAGKRLAFLIYGFVVLAVSGCGYQLAGQSSFLPKDVRTIYVEPFTNRSRDVGIEKEITTAVRGEFYRRGQLRLVEQADQADAILSGVVRSVDSSVVSVNRKDEVLQYESVMVLDVSLRRREPNEIIWRGQGTRLTELHSGSRAAVVTTSSEFKNRTLNASDVRRMTDIQLTETDNREFRDQLMERFARELHQRLMEMF
jgi:outer membrane lipopolysaccharide assembly protein LptE/RlpB